MPSYDACLPVLFNSEVTANHDNTVWNGAAESLAPIASPRPIRDLTEAAIDVARWPGIYATSTHRPLRDPEPSRRPHGRDSSAATARSRTTSCAAGDNRLRSRKGIFRYANGLLPMISSPVESASARG